MFMSVGTPGKYECAIIDPRTTRYFTSTKSEPFDSEFVSGRSYKRVKGTKQTRFHQCKRA